MEVRYVDIHTGHYETLYIEEDQLPDECPICHQGIHATSVWAVEGIEGLPNRYDVAFQCSKNRCKRLFVGSYVLETFSDDEYQVILKNVLPRTPRPPNCPEVIAQISKQFATIFSQASAAESYGLDQVCGVGYRKALEFLIKDYAISTHPDQKDLIERAHLSPCIRDYVDNPKVQLCAEKAAWIGNDETHYLRKWEDHDISDLKTLIRLTVIWIESEMLTRQYGEDMSKG